MDLKDPGPNDDWPPNQFWECPECGRHFWTTYPPPKKPAPPKPAAPINSDKATGASTTTPPPKKPAPPKSAAPINSDKATEASTATVADTKSTPES